LGVYWPHAGWSQNEKGIIVSSRGCHTGGQWSGSGGTIISETLTGTITGGFDSGANGANDDADIFGGGNLYGATATMSFSYDIDALNTAATNGTNGSQYVLLPGAYEYYRDFTDDGSVTFSVTIGAMTDAFSNNHPSNIFNSALIENCNSSPSGCGRPLLDIAGTTGQLIFEGITTLPLGQLGNQADIQDFLSQSTNGYMNLSGPTLGANVDDELNVQITSASDTPEPTTWNLVALGLGGVARLKRRHRFSEKFSK
jgi:hypothetical protein